MEEKFIKKEGTQTIILNPEWIKKNYPDSYNQIANSKLSQIEKENKLGDWLRKNHPKIWEKWLDTLPSATDLRKEFHKAGIKKI